MVGRHTNTQTHKSTLHSHTLSSPAHIHPTHTHITQSCNQFSTCRLQWLLLYLLSAALQFSIKMFAQKTPSETAVPRAGKRAWQSLSNGPCHGHLHTVRARLGNRERGRQSTLRSAKRNPQQYFSKIFSIVKFLCLLLLLPLLLYYIFLLA